MIQNILLKTWTCLYNSKVENIFGKNWFICAIEGAFRVLMEEIRYKEKMGLWVRSKISKYWILTHVSQDHSPLFRQSYLFVMSDFTERALMTNADSTPQLMLLLWVFICAWAFWARNVVLSSLLIPMLKPLAKCIWSSSCNSKEQTLTM